MPLTEEIRTYLSRQRRTLIDPVGFVDHIRPVLASDWGEPISYLLSAVAISFALAKVNINLFGERIQRVATVPDLVVGQGTVILSALLFAFVGWIIFKWFSGKASFLESLALLLYVVSFVLPVLTLVLIVGTRLASVILHETILFMPPMRTVGFGGPETDLRGFVVAAALTTLSLYWDLYVVWLLWKVLTALHHTSRIAGGIALSIALGISSLLTHSTGQFVNSLVVVTKPIWELVR